MTDTPAPGLDGTTYLSTSTEGRELVDGSTIRLNFEDGRLAAVAGCNTLSASYAVTDGRLAWVGPPVGTLMACPEDLMAQDAWLSGLLEDGVGLALDGDALTLVAGDVTLHFARADAGSL